MNGDASVGDMAGRPERSPRAAADGLAATFDLRLYPRSRPRDATARPRPEWYGAPEGAASGCVTHLATVHYGVPKEAVANLLRLPSTSVPTATSSSASATSMRNVAPFQSPSVTTPSRRGHGHARRAGPPQRRGTRVAVWADGARTLERVRLLLDDRLAPYQLAP